MEDFTSVLHTFIAHDRRLKQAESSRDDTRLVREEERRDKTVE